MDEELPGHWERLERKRRNIKLAAIGILAVAGFGTGFMIGRADGPDLFGPEPILSPAVAIGLAVLFLAAVGIGAWLVQHNSDEVEMLVHYKAAATSGSVLMIVYPVWFLLWKGALAPEPMHGVLFLLFVVSCFAALAWYRSR